VKLVDELFVTISSRNKLRMHFADIANQTLLDMVEVLRNDGVSQEAIAASLGLTINGFRAKVKQLRERYRDRFGAADEAPRSFAPRTLLERVFEEVEGHDARGVTSLALHATFRSVKPDSLRGVLHFLVKSGLLSVSGSGRSRVYRVAHRRASAPGITDAMSLLYREGPLTLATLAQRLAIGESRARELVGQIESAGRLIAAALPDGQLGYAVPDFHIPVESPEGFEAALYDHLSTVMRAICKKVRSGRHQATMRDTDGGATFSFDVPLGDPLGAEIRAFLPEMRARLEQWLARSGAAVAADPAAERERVTIYVGQMTEDLA